MGDGKTAALALANDILPGLDKDGVADDIHLFDEKLPEDYYNYHRPHSALPDPVRTTGRQDESGNVTGVLGTYPPA